MVTTVEVDSGNEGGDVRWRRREALRFHGFEKRFGSLLGVINRF